MVRRVGQLGRLSMSAWAAVLLVSSAHAQAQGMKPGLWESRTTMQGSPEMDRVRAEVKKQMAALPPEQRKQMEKMMADQGIGIGMGSDGEMVTKTCMTKELLERAEQQGAPPDADPRCTYRNSTKRGNVMTFGFTCTQPPSSGDGTMTFQGDGSYKSTMTMKAERGGKTETMTMTTSGRYLGSDCGNVKPLVLPKQGAAPKK